MEKRYQVFVSSTYEDLKDERTEVMQALLELDCIPAGMELFPAADEDQWSLIKRVIDDCDYYLVIVAGRYGSLGPADIGYTEMEYKYALEQSKPVIGFIHKDPGSIRADRCETGEENKRRLENFKALIQKKMCSYWDSPGDLGGKVSRSLLRLIKTKPATGWVRADMVPDAPVAEEILSLKRKVEELETALEAARIQAPEGTDRLAQGDDTLDLSCTLYTLTPWEHSPTAYPQVFRVTWDQLFAYLSPRMMDGLYEDDFQKLVNTYADQLAQSERSSGVTIQATEVDEDTFHTIKVQLRALGLIQSDSSHWVLTPYGDSVMTRLRAVPSPSRLPS